MYLLMFMVVDVLKIGLPIMTMKVLGFGFDVACYGYMCVHVRDGGQLGVEEDVTWRGLMGRWGVGRVTTNRMHMFSCMFDLRDTFFEISLGVLLMSLVALRAVVIRRLLSTAS